MLYFGVIRSMKLVLLRFPHACWETPAQISCKLFPTVAFVLSPSRRPADVFTLSPSSTMEPCSSFSECPWFNVWGQLDLTRLCHTYILFWWTYSTFGGYSVPRLDSHSSNWTTFRFVWSNPFVFVTDFALIELSRCRCIEPKITHHSLISHRCSPFNPVCDF